MKRRLFILSLSILFISFLKAQNVVSVKGRQILLNGKPYQVRGFCYDPVGYGKTRFDGVDFSKLSTDISLMKGACVNTIRTYYPITDESALNAFAAAGIKIIMGFPSYDDRGAKAGPDMQGGSYLNYIQKYRSHPAILMWEFGNEYNYHPEWFGGNIANWYGMLNNAANAVHQLDPDHPVATAHGELPSSQAISMCPSVDVWGMNVYRWDNPETIFKQWFSLSGKPMYLSEAGTDSYNQMTKTIDESMQAQAMDSIWNDVSRYSALCSGATFFEFSDNLSKAWNGSAYIQETGGAAYDVPYDKFGNEEFFGSVDINRTPKKAFNMLGSYFCKPFVVNNPPVVSITSPSNNSSYKEGESIVINVSASDTDGKIYKVELFDGNTKIGEDYSYPYSFIWNFPKQGTHSITARAFDYGWATAVSSVIAVTVNAVATAPFSGMEAPIPGRIEAEDYDIGGQGVAYFDKSPGNAGNTYRDDDVDIQYLYEKEYRYSIGYVQAGEWLKYSVNVKEDGKYNFSVNVASPLSGRAFHLEMDGVNISGSVAVPNSGGWNTFVNIEIRDIPLKAGSHILKVYMETDGFKLNYIETIPSVVSTTSTPYKGTHWIIPGKVEAEDYDEGGNNVGYFDSTPANINGSYRSDGVDISEYKGDARFSIGYITPGEWLKYTVNVTQSGRYDLKFNVSSIYTDKKLHMEVDGKNITGLVSIPNTGGWNVYNSVSVQNVSLTSGIHVFRVYMDTDGLKFNYFEVVPVTANQTPVVNITSPASNSEYTEGNIVEIAADASDDMSVVKVEFYLGNNKVGEKLSAPYSLILSNLSAGSYSLSAKAFDNTGLSSISPVFQFSVKSHLKNPENPSGIEQGISYNYYEGNWSSVPDFSGLNTVKTGKIADIDQSPRRISDYFGFRYYGYINVPTDGVYTFYTLSDDGSKFYIGDQLIVNNDGIHPAVERSGSIGLKAGKHRFVLDYFDNSGGEVIVLSYEGPGITKQRLPASAFYRSVSGSFRLSHPDKSLNAGSFFLYPNPVSSFLNVRITSQERYNVKIRVTDVDLRTKILTEGIVEPGVNNLQILMSELESGIYFINIDTGRETFTSKVVLIK